MEGQVETLSAFLADPNLIYLVIVFGLWAGVTAAYVPGTGVIEVVAVVALGGALLMMAGLAVSWWAALLIIAGVLTFLLVPFINQTWARLAPLGLIAQAVGGLLLFPNFAVSWILIGLTIGMGFVYHQYALLPLLKRSRDQKAVIDDNGNLLGAYGRVMKTFDPIGQKFSGPINVRGETWTATSEKPLDRGDDVVVVERDGLSVFVEGVKHKHTPLTEEA